jgi:hypothetical protein
MAGRRPGYAKLATRAAGIRFRAGAAKVMVATASGLVAGAVGGQPVLT